MLSRCPWRPDAVRVELICTCGAERRRLVVRSGEIACGEHPDPDVPGTRCSGELLDARLVTRRFRPSLTP